MLSALLFSSPRLQEREREMGWLDLSLGHQVITCRADALSSREGRHGYTRKIFQVIEKRQCRYHYGAWSSIHPARTQGEHEVIVM